MIAKLEMTQSNAQQNKDKHRTPTTHGKHTKQQINYNRTTQQPKSPGAWMDSSGTKSSP